MSDIEKALGFVERELELSDATGMSRDDWEDWRRIEVLLKKLQRLENAPSPTEQLGQPVSVQHTSVYANASGNNRRSG
ncbi:hypothetical protein J7481_19710 [Labrenzia sp. R4_2]|uniref:hypothetical protein n=1 Tax=Labrenzia sp. R4_2 TaxID=2821107 RepID=UPI001ADD441C|nr:hypothetical protein [Labrenzia sp. R4_2]MBO9421744.1 hypothetical protein [Labrenzia sp. R4_2]